MEGQGPEGRGQVRLTAQPHKRQQQEGSISFSFPLQARSFEGNGEGRCTRYMPRSALCTELRMPERRLSALVALLGNLLVHTATALHEEVVACHALVRTSDVGPRAQTTPGSAMS